MEACFAACLTFTQAEEGGYVADRRDSGNWSSGHVGQGVLVGSNMGIGAPTLSAWLAPNSQLSARQMRDLPFSTFEAIARKRYWEPLGCADFPGGVDLMLFDFGWNRGITTSLNLLFRCLVTDELPRGVGPHPVTPFSIVEALQRVSTDVLLRQLGRDGVRVLQQALGVREDGLAGPLTAMAFRTRPDLRATAIILVLSAAQIASYRLLSNFSIYGGGWLARSERREVTALAVAQRVIAVLV